MAEGCLKPSAACDLWHPFVAVAGGCLTYEVAEGCLFLIKMRTQVLLNLSLSNHYYFLKPWLLLVFCKAA
jgi:hypothetical protein